MKKITFLVAMFATALYTSAQSKITFEDQALNGASVVYNGTATVVANPVTTGINTSAYCLDVVNNGYAPVKFSNFNISSGSKTTYAYLKVKFKIAYKAFNGATSKTANDYASVDVFSSAASPVLDATDKLGTTSSVWNTPVTTASTDSLVWKQGEFVFSASSLATIPNGILVLKVAKDKCEYLLDDIEVIPSPVYGDNILTVNDFESANIGDAVPYYVYWSSSTAALGTCVIAADPIATSTKAVCITPTDYNGTASFTVTLPAGKTLDNYDRLYYDMYYSNAAGLNAQSYVYANSTKIFQVTSGYPSLGTSGVWTTKDHDLVGMPSVNSFALKIGLTSNNSKAYYLDNIKLHLTSTTTPVSEIAAEPLVFSLNNDQLNFTKTIDKVAVYSLEGKLVKTASNVSTVDMAGYNNGVYVMKVMNKGQNFVTKFVK